MALQDTLRKSLSGLFASNTRVETREPGEDERFAAELVVLSPVERRRRIETRQRYERFARRQMLTEAEFEATQVRDLH
jgi:hypothetical protein